MHKTHAQFYSGFTGCGFSSSSSGICSRNASVSGPCAPKFPFDFYHNRHSPREWFINTLFWHTSCHQRRYMVKHNWTSYTMDSCNLRTHCRSTCVVSSGSTLCDSIPDHYLSQSLWITEHEHAPSRVFHNLSRAIASDSLVFAIKNSLSANAYVYQILLLSPFLL